MHSVFKFHQSRGKQERSSTKIAHNSGNNLLHYSDMILNGLFSEAPNSLTVNSAYHNLRKKFTH